MPIDRLPKLALFGTWIHNTRSPTKAHTQTYWISEVLRTADIHQLDFFRLAQNRDPTKRDALIKQAFPHRTLTTSAKRALNHGDRATLVGAHARSGHTPPARYLPIHVLFADRGLTGCEIFTSITCTHTPSQTQPSQPLTCFNVGNAVKLFQTRTLV